MHRKPVMGLHVLPCGKLHVRESGDPWRVFCVASGLFPSKISMQDRIVCGHCKHLIDGKPRATLLGFQKYTCSSCGKETTYPLTGGYRLIYWLLVVMAVIGLISYAAQGEWAIPGALGVATVIALVQDYRLRKKVKTLSATSHEN